MIAQSSSLRFAGYAALFDIPDGIKDTLKRGAFSRTLRQRQEPVPLYFQHHPDQPIGVVESVKEDARGLCVIARFDNPEGRAAGLLRDGKVNGLSFGYRARRYRLTDDGRELDEVELLEISLVEHPLQHGARVHLVS